MWISFTSKYHFLAICEINETKANLLGAPLSGGDGRLVIMQCCSAQWSLLFSPPILAWARDNESLQRAAARPHLSQHQIGPDSSYTIHQLHQPLTSSEDIQIFCLQNSPKWS